MDRELIQKLLPWVDPLRPTIPDLYVARSAGAADPRRGLAKARINDSVRPCLLIGATGSGKSAELLRLALERAREPGGPVVVLLRLQDQCSPEQLSAGQVCFLLALSALKVPGLTIPHELERQLLDAYFGAIDDRPASRSGWNFQEIFDSLAIGVSDVQGVNATGATRARLDEPAQLIPWTKGLRNLPLPGPGLKLGSNDVAATRLASAVNRAIQWASHAVGRPIELFVDGLDRLDMSNVPEMFGSGVLNLVTAQVLYTAPIAIRYEAEGTQLEKLFDLLDVGNFAIFQRAAKDVPDGAHDERGFAAMRRILERRLQAADLLPDAVFEGGLSAGGPADRLIEASGGLPDLLIRLWDNALRSAWLDAADGRPPLNPDDMDASIREIAQRYIHRLDPRLEEPVLETWNTGNRPPITDANRLLHNNLILCYPNGFEWFRPLPLLLDWLRSRHPGKVPWQARDATTTI